MALLHDIDFTGAGGPQISYECGACGGETTAKGNDLELGDHIPGGNPDLIFLPACPGCGAHNFLLRTWDTHAEADTPARRATNALAEWLVDTDRSATFHIATHVEMRAKGKVPAIMAAKTGKLEDIRGLRQSRRETAERAFLAAAVEAAKAAIPKGTSPEDEAFEMARARRRAIVILGANRKAGRPPGATVSAGELAAAEAALTDELGRGNS